MNPFTTVQRKKALVWLSLFHLLVITSSNYLVQLPISIFGFHTTWGAFSFPFIFLATDLTVRIFGAPLARRIIFAVMVPALAISYGISALFYMGEWQGFAALGTFNLFVARIAVASFMAYALGQILDVHVFNRLRQSRRTAISRLLVSAIRSRCFRLCVSFLALSGAYAPALPKGEPYPAFLKFVLLQKG